MILFYLIYVYYLKLPQVGDVVVLDISATTIGKDELEVEKIPSAESKGLLIIMLTTYK